MTKKETKMKKSTRNVIIAIAATALGCLLLWHWYERRKAEQLKKDGEVKAKAQAVESPPPPRNEGIREVPEEGAERASRDDLDDLQREAA